MRFTPVSRGTVAGLVASTLAFVGLAIVVALRWHPLVGFDVAAVHAAHAGVLTRPWLRVAAVAVTDAGSPVAVDLVVVAIGAYLCVRRRVRLAGYLVAARLLELGVETAVKYLLARPRPALPNPVAYASGFSFPSGHTAGTTVLYVALLALATRRRAGPLAGVVALLVTAVAASRVLLGVHYPSDVIGGVLLGLACVFATQPLRPAPGRPDTGH